MTEEPEWKQDLRRRMALEKELDRLVYEGPAPEALTNEELTEIVHCLSVENQRMRVQISHLKSVNKRWENGR